MLSQTLQPVIPNAVCFLDFCLATRILFLKLSEEVVVEDEEDEEAVDSMFVSIALLTLKRRGYGICDCKGSLYLLFRETEGKFSFFS